MSFLLTRVHSILNLEYLQKAFSENFLRILESWGRDTVGRSIEPGFLCCVVKREGENQCSSHFTFWLLAHHRCIIQCVVWSGLGPMERKNLPMA